MPTLDEIWQSAGKPASQATTDIKPNPQSMDELWNASAGQRVPGPAPQRGVWDMLTGQTGPRYQLWPERAARSVAGAVMEGPKLMKDVAEGRVDPTSREGVGRAFGVAAAFSPRAPMWGGIATAAKGVARPPPTRQELFDEADRLYFDLRNNKNIPLAKADVDKFSESVRAHLNDRGFYAEDQPATFRALERLKNPVGANSTAKEVYAARTSLNNAARDNPGKSEGAAATAAMEHLDSFLAQIPEFAETANKARANYRAGAASERVEKAADRGELNAGSSGLGANRDNAQRQRIKALLVNDKVPKTPEEAALMKEIAMGGTVGNIARLFARLGPKHPLTGWGSAIGADLAGGSGLATVSLGVGALAQHIAERSTLGKIQRLDEMIRRNSPLGTPTPPPGRVAQPPISGNLLAPAAGSALAQPSEDALQ